jgi:oligosaccharide:H+ symporter
MMKAHHSHSYPLLSALLFFFFVTWSSSGSALYLASPGSGLKAGDTGFIYAVLSVSALFAQVCYGFIQDKLGLRKNLLWYITVLLILSGPAYLLFGYLLKINVLLGSIFGGIYIGLTLTAVSAYWNPTPSAWRARASLNSARRGCGARWAGRWRLSSPVCCLTLTRSLNFRSPAVPDWSSLSAGATAGLFRAACHAGGGIGR